MTSTALADPAAVAEPRNPMRWTLPACCARAASGHARRTAEQRDELAPSHVSGSRSNQGITINDVSGRERHTTWRSFSNFPKKEKKPKGLARPGL